MLIKTELDNRIVNRYINEAHRTFIQMRWMARTDLRWLCNHVLNYPDIQAWTHGPLIDIMQKFPAPPYEEWLLYDTVLPGQSNYLNDHLYRPYRPMYSVRNPQTQVVAADGITGKKRRLILDSRSSMKTTLNCVAHTIQWLLNYPAMAVAICQVNLDKAQDIVKEVADHFRFNKVLRELFPEMVPKGKVENWGTMNEFELPIRKQALQMERIKTRKEPSVRAFTLEGGSAGLHFDLIKFSDIVETKNTLTEEQMQKTIRLFDTSEYLLVSVSESWIDVEGTRYHGSDLYGKIVDQWEKNKNDARETWDVFVRGVWKRDVENPKFNPDELHAPYLLDAEGKPYSWWESRYPTKKIRRDYEEKPYEVACQLLNCPSMANTTLPLDPEIRKKCSLERDVFKKLPIAHHMTTVDTASSVGKKSDYTVITTCAWSASGRMYVHDIQFGKFTPDQIVEKIFEVQVRFRPMAIKMEKMGFELGLQAAIGRKRDTTGIYPNIQLIKRDTQTSKVERILNTLQSWYKNGHIWFLKDLPCLEQLDKELGDFPYGAHDDILDTLADQFQDKLYFGNLNVAREPVHLQDAPTWEVQVQSVYDNRTNADPSFGWANTPDGEIDGNLGF